MALDVPAIGSATQTIKYIRAAWDVTRDGGAAGLVSIPSQQVPAGARVLGTFYGVEDAFTDLGTSAFAVYVGPTELGALLDPVAAPSSLEIYVGETPPPIEGSPPILVIVTGDGYSAGSAYIYVFYV